MQLRDYQYRALADVERSFIAGNQRVMLYSPTGSGKTEMAISLIQSARQRGERAAFVVNRIGLVEQAAHRIQTSGIDCGVVQGANTRADYLPVLACSIQTLARRGHRIADLLIIDEAHATAGTKAYRELLEKSPAQRIVGLSATPFARGLGKRYPWGPLWQDMVVASTIRELIAAGHLVDCEIFAPSKPDLGGVRTVAGDWHEGDLGKAMDKPTLIGDIVKHWRELGGNKQTVVFATDIGHSQHITATFEAMGVRAEHIDCYTSDEDRREIMRRFNAGETRILSNVAVLAEGWDAPACEVMILARPTKSLSRYIQMAGRVLRPAPGKRMARILDHSDTCLRLGFPTDDLPLELDDGKPNQAAKVVKEREKLPKECPKCSYLKPAGVVVCPHCGHVTGRKDTVIVQDGALQQIKRAQISWAPQELYSELLGLAADRGLKPGWAAHKFRTCMGRWPNGLRQVAAPPSQPVIDWSRACYKAWKAGNPEPKPDFLTQPKQGDLNAGRRAA